MNANGTKGTRSFMKLNQNETVHAVRMVSWITYLRKERKSFY
jgi:hypothetical protein